VLDREEQQRFTMETQRMSISRGIQT
jgi:hypothetical protein